MVNANADMGGFQHGSLFEMMLPSYVKETFHSVYNIETIFNTIFLKVEMKVRMYATMRTKYTP